MTRECGGGFVRAPFSTLISPLSLLRNTSKYIMGSDGSSAESATSISPALTDGGEREDRGETSSPSSTASMVPAAGGADVEGAPLSDVDLFYTYKRRREREERGTKAAAVRGTSGGKNPTVEEQ